MARAVGLDLGSHAVRAAEVRLGGAPVVSAFGQVGLPRGVVEHGEVVDPGSVAAALKRLWREAGIGDRRVRVGLAGLRTIVRQVEMPAMPEDELRSALEFQAGEFIPLPPEDTLLDFQVLEQFTNDQGEDLARVLIAAIHRDTLQNALTAVREAGLQPDAVDLAPFALVRALGPLTPGAAVATEELDGAPPAAQAIVSVGSGVTIVAVHEAGVVRFVRTVDTGGDDVTAAIEAGLGITFEDAEALKRQLPLGVERADEARPAAQGAVDGLVGEIRGSIDFYTSQPESRPVGSVSVTGGGALYDGLLQQLADALGLPVDLAELPAPISLGDIGFLPDDLPRLTPYLPVPVGLALGGDKAAYLRINLLPSGERQRLTTQRLVMAGAAGLAVLAAGLGVLTMQRNDTLADKRQELADRQAENAEVQARITELQGAQDLQAESDAAAALLASTVAGEVSWSRVLLDVARVIPGDAWLQAFTGDAAAGTASFQGAGVGFPSAAAWLHRLATLSSFNDGWVGSVTAAELTLGGITVEGVNFTSTASLTEGARSERARRAAAGTPTAPAAPDPATEAAP